MSSCCIYSHVISIHIDGSQYVRWRKCDEKWLDSDSAMTFVAASTGLILAVERMSDEEVAVREGLDQANAKRASCFERHNIDPFNTTADVCLAEQEKARQSRNEFNEFMLEKQQAVPYQERRRQYNIFEEHYSILPLEELKDLHRKNCITKWGGHDSTECKAIASQISKKQIAAGVPANPESRAIAFTPEIVEQETPE